MSPGRGRRLKTAWLSAASVRRASLWRPRLQPTIRREIAPCPADLQIGDVPHPDLIRTRGQAIELAVGDAREEGVQPRNGPIQLRGSGAQARLAHKPRDPPPADPRAGGAESLVDPGAAIRPPALHKDGLDRTQQRLVLPAARAGASAPPGVVASPRDTVESAHPVHAKAGALGIDKREDLRLRSEQNRMAFFKSSCSVLSMACSRSRAWSRRISRRARDATSTRLALPLRTPSRTSFLQRDSMNGWMSSASATVCTSTPGILLSFRVTAVKLSRMPGVEV